MVPVAPDEQTGFGHEREKLFCENARLASHIAARFMPYVPPHHRAEVMGEARLGLWAACVKFDPARGRFSTYAAVVITNTVLHWLRHYRRHVARELSMETPLTADGKIALKDVLSYEQDFSGVEVSDLLRKTDADVLCLKLAGLSQKDIAARAGCSQASISRAITHARAELAKML